MTTQKDELVNRAIEAIHNGLSQRTASRQYGISQSTLSRRLRGTTSKRDSKISTQRLSPAQEEFICEWILNEEKAGRAPNRRQVADFATSILKHGHDHDKLGARWIDRFLKRNPNIRTKLSKPLESARVRGSTKEASRTGVSTRNLRSGFRKTGDDASPAEPSPPRTPPNEPVPKDNVIFPTPQKSKDILGYIHNLSSVDRDIRTKFTKAAKALDAKNAEIAALDHQIQYLQTQLELQKPRGKRKVREGGQR